MMQRILLSSFCVLLVLLPLGSTECTMDDFLRCDREIQSNESPIKMSISYCSKFYLKFPNFSFDSRISTTDLRSTGGVRARDDAGGVADLPQRHHQHRRRGRLRTLLLCSVPGLLPIKLIIVEMYRIILLISVVRSIYNVYFIHVLHCTHLLHIFCL